MVIKKLIAFSCIAVLSVGLIGCGTTSIASKSNWEISSTMDITQNNNIGGFYNDNFGITVGYAGEIHYTTDAGVTWPKSENVSMCRFGLDIVSERIAWCCGNGGNVRKTVDGGETWQKVTNYGKSEPDQCRFISFLSENTGWIASPDSLASTKDVGVTWTEIKLPTGINKIFSIELLNENIGYLVDVNNKFYTTKDGGATWNAKEIKDLNLDKIISSTNTSVLRFTDERNGTFFYYGDDNNLKCIKSTDGGDTWNNEILPEIKGNALYLSRDAKLLTVNSYGEKKITLLKSK